MKQLKKILAVALTVVLALALAVPAFADDDGTPKLPPLPDKPTGTASASMENHTFTAYQVFAGKLDTTNNALSAIKWGSAIAGNNQDVNVPEFLKELQEKFPGQFDNISYDRNYPNRSADAVLRVINRWQSNTAINADTNTDAYVFARLVDDFKQGKGTEIKKGGTIADTGYYLIVDSTTDPKVTQADGFARNLSFLNLRVDIKFDPSANVKVDIPELEKKVLEVNDSSSAAPVKGDWQDAAHHDIGDDVAFVLTGTLPSNYDAYESYKYVFHDTLSAGLTFDPDSRKVWLRNGNADPVDITGWFELDKAGDKQANDTFSLTCDDLKAKDTNKVLTANSYIQVVYMAKLNEKANVGSAGNTNTSYLQFSNNPNYRGDPTDPNDPPPTGNTPKDIVTVFTFKLVVNKVSDQKDEQGNPKSLTGAEFELYKKTAPNDQAQTQEEKDAQYTLVEGKLTTDSEDPTAFTFSGLDAGDYKLVESKVPQGYNRAEDMYFTIEAELGPDPSDPLKSVVKSLTVKDVKTADNETILDVNGAQGTDGKLPQLGITYDATSDALTTSIVNLAGVLLPSTGGIGTTVFYIVGGLLIVVAVVLLITKKRMGKQKETE